MLRKVLDGVRLVVHRPVHGCGLVSSRALALRWRASVDKGTHKTATRGPSSSFKSLPSHQSRAPGELRCPLELPITRAWARRERVGIIFAKPDAGRRLVAHPWLGYSSAMDRSLALIAAVFAFACGGQSQGAPAVVSSAQTGPRITRVA